MLCVSASYPLSQYPLTNSGRNTTHYQHPSMVRSTPTANRHLPTYSRPPDRLQNSKCGVIFHVHSPDMDCAHEHARYVPRARPVPTNYARQTHNCCPEIQRAANHWASTHHRLFHTPRYRVSDAGYIFHLPVIHPTRPQACHAWIVFACLTPGLHRHSFRPCGSVVGDHCAGECVV